MKERGVFLSWHRSRRSLSLARRARLPFYAFVADREGAGRHVLGILSSAWWVARHRPRLVWFQYSIGLGLVLAVYEAIRGSHVRLVADIHTKALRRDGGPWLRSLLLPVKRWTLARCSAVVVTNEQNRDWAKTVFAVEAVVLPDPLPAVPSAIRRVDPPDRRPLVVFICSYAADEPIPLLAEVAASLGPDASCVITGDPARLPDAARADLARSAHLTGFLPEPQYWGLLHAASAIVVPTTEPACLPCGAYEAVATGRRPILFEDAESRKVFGDLAVYTEPNAEALCRAIRASIRSGRPIREDERRDYDAGWARTWAVLTAEAGMGGAR